MTSERKEKLIDQLLVMMNDNIESNGRLPIQVDFDFKKDGENLKKFMENASINEGEAETIVKTCLSRGYIKGRYNNYDLSNILLTEEGQGRAISHINSKQNQPALSGSINIETINTTGQVQVGHGNIQVLEENFKILIDKIEKANANPQEKQSAKDALKNFLNQPVVTRILGGIASYLTSLL